MKMPLDLVLKSLDALDNNEDVRNCLTALAQKLQDLKETKSMELVVAGIREMSEVREVYSKTKWRGGRVQSNYGTSWMGK